MGGLLYWWGWRFWRLCHLNRLWRVLHHDQIAGASDLDCGTQHAAIGKRDHRLIDFGLRTAPDFIQ